MDVSIQESDRRSRLRERDGQIHRNSRFPHPTFTACHSDPVLIDSVL